MPQAIRRRRRSVALTVPMAAALAALAAGPALALVRGGAPGTWRSMRGGMVPGGGVGAGALALPVSGSDGRGNTWMVYQPTYIQSQANFPVYGQAAALQVNGQQPQFNNPGSAHVDEKTGELVIEGLTAGPLAVTRRVLLDTDDGGIRVTDVLRNTTATEQPATVVVTSQINYGVQQSQTVPDPKRSGRALAWVATVAAGPGRAAVDCYGGPGAKVGATVESQPGGNVVNATYAATVPANGQIALVHYHLILPTADQGTAWVAAMKPARMLADLPKDVRRTVVNFRVGGGLMGDQEVLRGDLLDAVELRNGDRLNGTLTDPSFTLDTFYGTVELPVDHVVGIVNAGAYRPRQLVVTTDGQIFSGHLQQPTIGLELSSGQKVTIPLAQIARLGYRHRPGEPSDDAPPPPADARPTTGPSATLRPPYVLLATGDRVGVTLPADKPITVVTRYGPLSLSPAVLSGITFTGEDSSVHTINLTDGSHFSGLVTVPDFEAVLDTGAGKPLTVHFPVGSISRIVFAGDDDDDDGGPPALKPAANGGDAPSLHLKRDDLLVGTLTGRFKVDTAFDTVTVNADEIRSISRGKDGGADLAVTTFDGTVFNGQVQDPTLACHLNCGIDVRVPVDLIDGYTNPSPAVPAMLKEQIDKLVSQLDADDWQARDAAEKQLVKLGPAVDGVLRGVRDKQPPEAQQRIDAVLRQLKKP